MSLFKFEPKEDISTYELALIIKTFLLLMHSESPNNNLELDGHVVNFLRKVDSNLTRHFESVEDYD